MVVFERVGREGVKRRREMTRGVGGGRGMARGVRRRWVRWWVRMEGVERVGGVVVRRVRVRVVVWVVRAWIVVVSVGVGGWVMERRWDVQLARREV